MALRWEILKLKKHQNWKSKFCIRHPELVPGYLKKLNQSQLDEEKMI